MVKPLIISSLLFTTASIATAQEMVEESTAPVQVADIQTDAWYFGAGQAKIDRQTAFEECIDSTATSLYLGYEAQDGHLVYGGGLSGLLYGDNCKFSQDVEDGFGDRSRAGSSAEGFGLFGEVGYSFTIEPNKAYFDVTAGIEQMLISERSIASCSNCYSEDIDVNGGLYLRPKFKFIAENGFTFSISYHHYLSSDINRSISLQFGMTTDMF